MSGVIIRASYIYFDGRMMERGCGSVEYGVYVSSNSDCLDRYMIRINESLNSVSVVWGICGVWWWVCEYGWIVSKSMMQSIIGWYVCGGMGLGGGMEFSGVDGNK